MSVPRSKSPTRVFKKNHVLALGAAIWVALVGAAIWHFLIRPWSIAGQVVIGMSEAQVLELLGPPDLDFRSDRDLRSSLLVPGSYVFTPIPGPDGERPLTLGWLRHSGDRQPVSANAMPTIEERAVWYDPPLTAGILVYLKDGKVTRTYHGGT